MYPSVLAYHIWNLMPCVYFFRYLILYMKRFTRNTFFTEKNPTIVNFPIRNVDFGDVLALEARKANPENVYDLVANIVHEGEPNKGTRNNPRLML